jgi:Arc/MetJ-type ribon-helix-helix transcriptional regulator
VKKTTVYLPDHLKKMIEFESKRDRRSEAEVIRAALEKALTRPRPKLPLFKTLGGDGRLAERVDEILAEGFGED